MKREKKKVTSADALAVNDKGIKLVITDGAKYDFNRQIPANIVKQLDPDGWHVLKLMLFDHRRDNPSDPMHHRYMALLKLTGNDDPFEMLVDIADEDRIVLEKSA